MVPPIFNGTTQVNASPYASAGYVNYGNLMDPPFQDKPNTAAGRPCDYTMASTGHTGGIVVVMADGSSRNVSPQISSSTWFAVFTPNSGDLQGSDW